MKELYNNSKIKEIEIRYLMRSQLKNYRLEIYWEHDFDKLVKTQAYINFMLSLNNREALDKKTDATITERDFFYGGRVNALKFYMKKKSNNEIKYFDVCSLYPYVCKRKSYPKGHPEIIRENFNMTYGFYYGIMKCKLLPPKKLFHPAIPIRINNRLIFTLCYSCAKTTQHSKCNHSDEERSLYGEWGTPEIYKSLELGYQLVKIFCVLHYKTKFEYKNENEPGLFGGYVNNWLKEKVEASGFPGWVQTENDKDTYISDYFKNEGITLNKSKIHFRAGDRSLAKLFLNSIFGKLAYKGNRPKTKFIDEKIEFVDLLIDDSIDITFYDIINDNRLMVSYINKNAGLETNYKGNVIVGSFVTMWARMYLLEQLLLLNKRVIYFDTDSLIFTHKEGEYQPLLGDFLGNWSDELPSGVKIKEFVSTGPKSYCLRLSNGGAIVKIKGITQNYANKDKLSFSSMKSSVFCMAKNKSEELSDGIIITNKLHFCRNKVKSTISNKGITKVLKFKYTKRMKYVNQADPFITYPFGYDFD